MNLYEITIKVNANLQLAVWSVHCNGGADTSPNCLVQKISLISTTKYPLTVSAFSLGALPEICYG